MNISESNDRPVAEIGLSSAPNEPGASESSASGSSAATKPSVSKPDSTFRFGRMFPELESRPFRPDDQSLVELGEAMLSGTDTDGIPGLPAGYTFVAQFITHDITLDETIDIPEEPIALETIKQGRSPFLDLESVYGKGPGSENSDFYKGDALSVGLTSPEVVGDANRTYDNDLPRSPVARDGRGNAIIGDPRNDENLGLAQMHVAFLRFHNSVARRLAADVRTGLFEAVREKVIRHYQWIVLHDFLPRIVEEPILKKALENPPTHLKADFRKNPFMPIEFSAAAFRLGHSMLRDEYQWNRVFQSPPNIYTDVARLFDLAMQTGFGSLKDDRTLPSNWIIDWTRFFDFTGHNGIATNPKLNLSGKFDSTIARTLKPMGRFLTHISRTEFKSLAVLDLIRGSRIGLPTGQDVAQSLGLAPLPPSDIARGPHFRIIEGYDFDKKTPLWFYILKEAEVVHGGRRLGPVGSSIVAETLVELIRCSPHSILNKDVAAMKGLSWKPDLGQIDRDAFGITDLLVMANVVNPLGA